MEEKIEKKEKVFWIGNRITISLCLAINVGVIVAGTLNLFIGLGSAVTSFFIGYVLTNIASFLEDISTSLKEISCQVKEKEQP